MNQTSHRSVPSSRWLIGGLALALVALAPAARAENLTLTAPLERQVVQRDARNIATLTIAGTISSGADRIEARMILAPGAARGHAVGWTVIARLKPPSATDAAKFEGTLHVSAGGWYRLEVRARKGRDVVAAGTVEKVGAGDVFVTAGQSNSANFGQVPQHAEDERVVYFDGQTFGPAKDPIPGGFGGGGSVWALVGDGLVKAWNVPVCFRSATLTYTPVAEWLPEAKTTAQYATLITRIKEFGPRGVRAVLWHQGESDSLANTTAEQYRDRLTRVIEACRHDVGYPIDWFVAQASLHPGSNPPAMKRVADGQHLIWQSKVAFPGPVTDDLLGPDIRYDGVHFSAKGLQLHAERWRVAILAQYKP